MDRDEIARHKLVLLIESMCPDKPESNFGHPLSDQCEALADAIFVALESPPAPTEERDTSDLARAENERWHVIQPPETEPVAPSRDEEGSVERRLLDLGTLRNAIDNALGGARSRAAADFDDKQHQGQRGQDWDRGFLAAWTIVEAQCETARTALKTSTPETQPVEGGEQWTCHVPMGSYETQVELVPPEALKRDDGRGICVDLCLAREISALWQFGVVTNGCCCGHGQVAGYIGVSPVSVPAMEVLGYRRADHLDGAHFIPKSPCLTSTTPERSMVLEEAARVADDHARIAREHQAKHDRRDAQWWANENAATEAEEIASDIRSISASPIEVAEHDGRGHGKDIWRD